jgi:hypothetical protein
VKAWQRIALRCIAMAPLERPVRAPRVSAERAREIVRRMRERERASDGQTRMEFGNVERIDAAEGA